MLYVLEAIHFERSNYSKPNLKIDEWIKIWRYIYCIAFHQSWTHPNERKMIHLHFLIRFVSSSKWILKRSNTCKMNQKSDRSIPINPKRLKSVVLSFQNALIRKCLTCLSTNQNKLESPSFESHQFFCNDFYHHHNTANLLLHLNECFLPTYLHLH